ncbi:periplasmic heavy metal sensor [Oceanomicrobium pacificus]|uniref:Periplasmic heavy metal sensor n=1 Tax=Oceanomicrobium pacificus TaxID=2692916 RepID=A0A6B0TS47_9RHOB|nr:periplasmic heavy metal sensor [Oceanomicrobium pacificus]MXU63843.1 periplasmic heavy metal sensor [Oceanomicrobium pacificus]
MVAQATETPPPPGNPRWPLWLKLTLLGSLCLNMVLIGLLAGFALRGPMQRNAAIPPAADTLRLVVSAMPADARGALRRTIRRDLPDMRRARGGDPRDALVTVLTADPFDPAAMAALFDGQRARAESATAALHGALATRIAELSPEERAAMAERIANAPRRGPGGRDGKKD